MAPTFWNLKSQGKTCQNKSVKVANENDCNVGMHIWVKV
jgi:hypothetical protein